MQGCYLWQFICIAQAQAAPSAIILLLYSSLICDVLSLIAEAPCIIFFSNWLFVDDAIAHSETF